jgi:signal transduction histidine kinase
MTQEARDLQLLRQTFQEFIATSTELEGAYNRLKEESQTLSVYLGSILENMEDAILVVNPGQEVVLWNSPALAYIPGLTGLSGPLALASVSTGTPFDVVAFLTGDDDQAEKSLTMGAEVREVTLSRRPFFSPQRAPLGQLLIISDQTELKRLERRSRQEDRLRVMGELAAEMAHEIRNPLGSIELMVSLLEQDLKPGSENKTLIDRLRSAVQIMNHTVSNVLLFTREIQLKKRLVELGPLLSQSETAILAHINRQQLRLTRSIPDITLPLDAELMQQALANLLLNAAQVSPRGGRIHISGLIENHRLQLSLSDEGPGIGEEVRKKLFTPFFTTKNSGTGLGLAMVKRVVEAHQGTIECLAVPHGASFLLTLPLE